MEAKSYCIPVFDLLLSLSTSIDLLSPEVSGHHKRVAYIALVLGQRLNFTAEELRDLLVAASMHDIGAFSQAERIDLMRFEADQTYAHSIIGYEFLQRFPLFIDVAKVIRYHHVEWNGGRGATCAGDSVPRTSHLLHLADRVDAAVNHDRPILAQAPAVRELIVGGTGSRFRPEFVQSFMEASLRESFWLDLSFPRVEMFLNQGTALGTMILGIEELEGLAQVFCHLIDFKSPYTATHSTGVAAAAGQIAKFCGFSRAEQREFGVAGLLHDIGKLALPAEILNKESSLTDEEFSAVRAHAYYSKRMLEGIHDLSTIVGWGCAHHERLDGNGYPFHEGGDELPLGARILAVADVLTALSEARPYRSEMSYGQTLQLLDEMGDSGKLDQAILAVVRAHSVEIQHARESAQQRALKDYQELASRLPLPTANRPWNSAHAET